MTLIRALLVEDEIDILFIVNLTLARSGYFEVTAFESGVAALDALAEDFVEFDFILVNSRLPAMNGLQFLKILKAMPLYAHLPAVVITAALTQQERSDYEAAGVIGVIAKPFDVDTLHQQILDLYRAAEPSLPARETGTQ